MERQKRTIVISITISLIALSIVASATLLSTKGTLEKSRIDLYSVKNQADSIFQGSIQATKEEDISLDSSLGTLASINVKNQQNVKAGDVLLTYNAKSSDLVSLEYAVKTAQLMLSNSQDSLATVQAKAVQLQDKYNNAVAAQKKAQDEAKKAEDLAKAATTGSSAAAVPSTSSNTSDTTTLTEDPDAVQSEIDSNNDTIQQDQQQVATNQLALEEAQANLQQAQNSQTVTVKAQESGMAIVGDVNDTTKPIIEILSKETSVNTEVSEFDYAKVKLGEKVKVRTLNLNNTITGTIDSVSPVPAAGATGSTSTTTASTNIAYYKFTVKPDQNLQYGYDVQVMVPNNEIMIPLSAVKNNFVELKQANGKFKKVAVNVQKKDGQYQVLSGLKVGDKIAKNGRADD